MKPYRERFCHAAFTLMELLVVLAIVGMLGSLLLPALGRSWRTALRSGCAHNLRQLGVAAHLYAGDHRGYLPVMRTDDSCPQTVVYTATDRGSSCLWSDGTAQGFGWLYQRGYVGNPRVFYCTAPLNLRLPGFSGPLDFNHVGAFRYAQWRPPEAAQTTLGFIYCSYESPRRYVSHPQAAEACGGILAKRFSPVLAEVGMQAIAVCSWWGAASVEALPPHQGQGINALFADGATSWLPADDELNRMGSGSRHSAENLLLDWAKRRR